MSVSLLASLENGIRKLQEYDVDISNYEIVTNETKLNELVEEASKYMKVKTDEPHTFCGLAIRTDNRAEWIYIMEKQDVCGRCRFFTYACNQGRSNIKACKRFELSRHYQGETK